MLERIKLENFKSHTATELRLGAMTLLVGSNATGKSSILTAAHAASLLPRVPFEHIFKEESAPDVMCRRGADHFALSLAGHNAAPWSMELRVQRSSDPEEEDTRSWEPVVESTVGQTSMKRDPRQTDPKKAMFATPREITQEISSTVFLKFDARKLASPSYSDKERPRIEYDGSGLASVIAHLKLAEEEGFERLTDTLRRIVPTVRKIRIRRVPVVEDIRYRERVGDEWRVVRDTQTHIGDELLLDFKGAEKVPAHAASEGTLMALGLITVLYSPSRPKIILLDDIEQGFHPRAQQELIAVIQESIQQHPGLQIVATSHSPYLVDEVAPEDVWVLALRDDGSTACRRLCDHPDARRALEVLTSGEFLSAEGEDWVIAE